MNIDYLLPVLLALLAGWLFIGPERRAVTVSPEPSSGRRRSWLVAASGVAVVAGSTLVWGSAGVIWSAVAAMVVGTVWKVARDHRRRLLAQRRSRQVTEAARALAGRLSVGEVPSVALSSAASELGVLAPVQRAQEVGADVPEALLVASESPGQESFSGLARAWRMAEVTGAPLAGATSGVAEAMRRRTRLEATVDAELAGPRASGRLMGLLPLAGLGMAQMVGAEPASFLLSSMAGRMCVLGAAALSCAGVLWSEALANRVYRESLP